MLPDSLDKLDWLTPWQRADAELESQLKKEAGPSHPLYGQEAIALGRRIDSDDVLFYLPGHMPPLAVIHLTWQDTTGSDPRYPWTVFYSSIEDWVEESMKPDHSQYVGGL